VQGFYTKAPPHYLAISLCSKTKNLFKNFTYELVGTLKLTHEKNWEKGDTMTRRGLKVLQALVDNNV
jgi:hypothetical protein